MKRAADWALMVLVVVATVAGVRATSGVRLGARVAPDTTYVNYADTVVLRRGLDTLWLRIPVPATFPVGRYWWHLHGPNLITKLSFKGVAVVK